MLSVWLNFFSIIVNDPITLIPIRFLADLAEGIIFSLVLAEITASVNTARNSGLMIVSQVIFSAVGIFFLSFIDVEIRLGAMFLFTNFWIFVVLFLGFKTLYFESSEKQQDNQHAPTKFNAKFTLVVIGTGLYFLTIGAVWGIIERISTQYHIPSTDISSALAFSALVSLGGSLIATYLGVKYGRFKPFAIAAIFQLSALILITKRGYFEGATYPYVIAILVFQFFLSFILLYQIILLAESDLSGRFVGYYGASAHAALAAGPYLASQIISNE